MSRDPRGGSRYAFTGHVGWARGAMRWAGTQVWRALGRVHRNRQELYGGATGIRIVTFHGTPPATLAHLQAVVAWWRERAPMATPADVDDLMAGRWQPQAQDKLLVTFDDGLASNYAAAALLAEAGVRAVFFVVPSLVDRNIGEFLRFHEERGVVAYPPIRDQSVAGLSRTQVREMVAMGHRIGAHNYAHRDLGQLHDAGDLSYEIGGALSEVAELTGSACRDFAIGFGQPENLSAAAADYLQQRCANVFSCHRGLNVPGRTPRFLLRHAHEPGHPMAFTRVCLEGGADHRLAGRIREMERRVGRLPAPAGVAA